MSEKQIWRKNWKQVDQKLPFKMLKYNLKEHLDLIIIFIEHQ